MDFMLDIDIPKPGQQINYRDSVMLTGSCFTEHIGSQLQMLKFDVLQNPNGILFDPFSVADSLVSYVEKRQYLPTDLFYLNELWQSWHHHSIFSHVDQQEALRKINTSQERAHAFLRKAKWLVITLGTSFSYRLRDDAGHQVQGYPGMGVANCHRAPAQWFNKRLMSIEEISAALDHCIHRLFHFNPGLQLVFTVSPVRHIRDGVIENNRSKARLIEVVHYLVNKFDQLYYFPAYELVVDVLRDYRFYDSDMVHPNYQATSFVLEKFTDHFMDAESREITGDLRKIVIARKHRAFQPETMAHRQFLQSHLDKTKQLKSRFPFLDLEEELNYFSGRKM
jgi:GSCFA family